MVRIAQLGLSPEFLDYQVGWTHQRTLHEAVVNGTADDTLLLCEHPPVFTAGRSARPDEYPADGTPVVPVTRGGRVTWHGPGQLVGYPIMRLTPLGDDSSLVDVVGHVRALERVLVHTAAHFGVDSFRVPGRSGVWVTSISGTPAKIGAIGIRVERGASLHGFALNCSGDLAGFAQIVPCGIRDAGVSSLSIAAGREISTATAAAVIAANFDAWYHSPEPSDFPQQNSGRVLAHASASGGSR
ncbi:lipoyl(octanoyl) transferase LipB [Mycetocola tolaasinivorans]|uniref:Octanoyltransferase n=1 Tax=Mycetocola tolaasinivorans TaxID=76635 RepID=A0A3L6ZVL4_9MICO|nr:lipoyl(octanoyl) transferase LipB [Mycetocola tolaasinivorans]RLP71900.1 lipoyl(octanoyl) transferase LipB [Mycetocola tolaasinivorans]